MEEPTARFIYDVDEEEDVPCWLWETSQSNIRPPLLTRVCRKWLPKLRWRRGAWKPDGPYEADWDTGNVIDEGCWQDASRDSPHMMWTQIYDIEFYSSEYDHHLTSLAQEAKRMNGSASFMLDELIIDIGEEEPFDRPISQLFERRPLHKGRPEDLEALKLLPEWMVVVRVVVIHLDFKQAADSGLFGLLGDEIIQVVDATLPLVEQLYELAEQCERGASAVTCAQDFTRMSADDMDAMVKRVAFKVFHDSEIGKRLRPAIMFRLCTRMCNHINTPKQEEQNV
ncbi:hypothetical protein E4T48_04076 [Aureobasidium sp. EXF-10727]|nr:hypothetical protein E4T48_04076 [Aureobasidium sp. EXF-10727]